MGRNDWFEILLVPLTRHSILLVAMGWSPVHALRIHIVAGWFAWWCIVIHGIMFVVDWFKYQPLVIGSIWPDPRCWTWKYPDQAFAGGRDEFGEVCTYPLWNFTGIIAFVFLLALAASSIHWFRRKNYRLFYILHGTFGFLMLLATKFHWPGCTGVLMPSLVYYLASTSPTSFKRLPATIVAATGLSRLSILVRMVGTALKFMSKLTQ
jgi:Ferric reductase like transmembrane component